MRNLKKHFLKLFKNTWPFILIIFVVCIFFWKVFLKGQVPIPGDFIVGVYYPWLDYKWGFPTGVPVKNPMTTDVVSLIFPEQMLGIDLLKSGELPLWNPFILTGTPLFANLQAASFSLTNFVYFMFDQVNAWSIQIILQHVLAATFTYLLLRHWKVSKLGSVFGSLVFSFSGFNMIFSQWNGHTLTSAFIPLILLFEDRFLAKAKYLDGLGFSFSLFFQLLAGYPQTSFYTFFAIVILWLVRIKFKKSFYYKTFLLGIFGILALGISSFQLFPARELWGLSQRDFEPHPFEWAFLPWKKIITFIAPDYFGNHSTQNYWGPQDYTSNTAYIGVIAMILSVFSVKLIKKREVLFLFILSIFSLLMSFCTPLSRFLWENNIFSLGAASAHRATILFTFAMACLTGFGVDVFVKSKNKKDSIIALFIPYLIILLFVFYAFSLKGDLIRGIPIFRVAFRNLAIPGCVLISATVILFLVNIFKNKYRLLGICLLGFLSVFELFWTGWKFTPFSNKDLIYPSTPVLDFLAKQEKPFRVTGNKVIPVNMRSYYRLESLEGYETIHSLRISQFLAIINSSRVGTDPVGRYGTVDNDTSALLDLVNTKYYLTLKRDINGVPSVEGQIPERFITDRFKVVFEDKTVVVLESESSLPRAFMVYNWEIIQENEEILNNLLEKDFSFSSKIILEDLPSVKVTNDISKSSVIYEEYKEQKSALFVETEKEGMLFVSDLHYPGWKAFVDGKEVKIYRADFAFRAIAIPEGKHNVEFVYKPSSFFQGLKLSALSLLAIILLGLAYKFGRKRFSNYT
ncbi:MAG: YfhO family protein [Patescibacteria group bacterium]